MLEQEKNKNYVMEPGILFCLFNIANWMSDSKIK